MELDSSKHVCPSSWRRSAKKSSCHLSYCTGQAHLCLLRSPSISTKYNQNNSAERARTMKQHPNEYYLRKEAHRLEKMDQKYKTTMGSVKGMSWVCRRTDFMLIIAVVLPSTSPRSELLRHFQWTLGGPSNYDIRGRRKKAHK